MTVDLRQRQSYAEMAIWGPFIGGGLPDYSLQ